MILFSMNTASTFLDISWIVQVLRMVLPWRLLTRRCVITSLQSCRLILTSWFAQIIWVGWLNPRGKEVREFCFGFLTVFALFPLAVQYFETIVHSVFNILKQLYSLPLAYSCAIFAAPSRICRPARRILNQESILTGAARYSRLWLGYAQIQTEILHYFIFAYFTFSGPWWELLQMLGIRGFAHQSKQKWTPGAGGDRHSCHFFDQHFYDVLMTLKRLTQLKFNSRYKRVEHISTQTSIQRLWETFQMVTNSILISE